MFAVYGSIIVWHNSQIIKITGRAERLTRTVFFCLFYCQFVKEIKPIKTQDPGLCVGPEGGRCQMRQRRLPSSVCVNKSRVFTGLNSTLLTNKCWKQAYIAWWWCVKEGGTLWSLQLCPRCFIGFGNSTTGTSRITLSNFRHDVVKSSFFHPPFFHTIYWNNCSSLHLFHPLLILHCHISHTTA